MPFVVSGSNLLRFFVCSELRQSNQLIALDRNPANRAKDVAYCLVVVRIDDRQLASLVAELNAVHQ